MTNNPTIDGVSRCKTCRGSGWIDNLRSVGTPAAKCPDCAPAVERQEPKPSQVPVLRAMAANYRNGHSWDFLDGEAVSKAADEITAQASTIARLEARVAELESGRGEPIYEQRYGGGWINIGREEYERCLADPEEASSLRIVFTAPPAPVSVADENLAYACELLHAWKCLYEDMRWNDASAFSSTEEFLGRLDAYAALNKP